METTVKVPVNRLANFQFSIENIQLLLYCYMGLKTFEAWGLFFAILPEDKITGLPRMIASILGGILIGGALTTVTLNSKFDFKKIKEGKEEKDYSPYLWIIGFTLISLFLALDFFAFFESYSPKIFAFCASLVTIEIKLSLLLSKMYKAEKDKVEEKKKAQAQQEEQSELILLKSDIEKEKREKEELQKNLKKINATYEKVQENLKKETEYNQGLKKHACKHCDFPMLSESVKKNHEAQCAKRRKDKST
ncbi:hypothetical protein [Aquimarina algiphila]|uniref:Uncharacterized protein n=1 Tax=Aquimarina algiphila TaxID=2047982 RepID=A0A554VRT0_9FLAO|nr:hypothetical protein [Aquimarina algiphila]TSE11331.1 hypothetical protein FOF46_01495 [Aquimarina algiphila]